MKKFLWGILTVIVIAGIGFGVWGYVEANKIKQDWENINRLIGETMVFEPIDQNQDILNLDGWEMLHERAPELLSELQNYDIASVSLKEKLNEYYGPQAQDRYKEAQYLQFLNEAQGSLDLKSTQPKSKGQIETIAKYYDDLIISGDDLSLGPKFDDSRHKVEKEAETFRENLNDIVVQMNNESPPVRLRTADLDKAIDELKQEIIQSLNDWVDLQNEIKDEIANINRAAWVIPF